MSNFLIEADPNTFIRVDLGSRRLWVTQHYRCRRTELNSQNEYGVGSLSWRKFYGSPSRRSVYPPCYVRLIPLQDDQIYLSLVTTVLSREGRGRYSPHFAGDDRGRLLEATPRPSRTGLGSRVDVSLPSQVAVETLSDVNRPHLLSSVGVRAGSRYN